MKRSQNPDAIAIVRFYDDPARGHPNPEYKQFSNTYGCPEYASYQFVIPTFAAKGACPSSVYVKFPQMSLMLTNL